MTLCQSSPSFLQNYLFYFQSTLEFIVNQLRDHNQNQPTKKTYKISSKKNKNPSLFTINPIFPYNMMNFNSPGAGMDVKI